MTPHPGTVGDERVTYAFRERIGQSIRLDVDASGIEHRSTSAGKESVAWRDVRRITLLSPAADVFVCRIERRNGPPLLVANRSVGDSEELRTQNPGYLDFVFALHGQAGRHPHIRFRAGSVLGFGCAVAVLVVLICLLAGYVGLLVLAMSRGRTIRAAHGLPLAPLGVVVPFLWYWARRNKPAAYEPDAPPDGLLPRRRDA